jgi:hypothetical protein
MLSPGKGLPVQERITSERFGHKGGNAIQLEQATEPATDRSAAAVRAALTSLSQSCQFDKICVLWDNERAASCSKQRGIAIL